MPQGSAKIARETVGSRSVEGEQLVQQCDEFFGARGRAGWFRPHPRYVEGDQRRLQRPVHVQWQPAAKVWPAQILNRAIKKPSDSA